MSILLHGSVKFWVRSVETLSCWS